MIISLFWKKQKRQQKKKKQQQSVIYSLKTRSKSWRTTFKAVLKLCKNHNEGRVLLDFHLRLSKLHIIINSSPLSRSRWHIPGGEADVRADWCDL